MISITAQGLEALLNLPRRVESLEEKNQILTKEVEKLKSNPLKKSFKRKEFAEELEISVSLFDKLRSSGEIPDPDFWVSHSPRWTPESVENYKFSNQS